MDTPITHDSQGVLIDDIKTRVNDSLDAIMSERIADAQKINPAYGDLWKSIETLSKAGGKRLRPYIMTLAYTMNQSNDIADVLPAAVAQELLHVAMLIHDDIIDRDDIRYGVKNISGQYEELYTSHVQDPVERRHFSSSAALLAGDLLITEAFKNLSQCHTAPETLTKAQALLAQSIFTVVGGELLDTESVFKPFDEVDAVSIATHKTASYSFVGPLVMGATLAHEPENTIILLKEFGTALGIAYQLKDDLLGTFGTEAVFGKSVSSDITEGKHTYLIECFYRLASDEQKTSFAPLFKNPQSTESELEQARQLLVDSGAKAATESMLSELATSATATLDTITMNEVTHKAFKQLIALCIAREK